MEIISRKAALSQGLTRYFTGKPCRHGHTSARLTSCYMCVDCLKMWPKTNVKAIERKRRYNREYQRTRKHSDVNFRLANNIRSRITQAVRHSWHGSSAIRELGCTIEEFRLWIEGQFQDGMTWDNWGRKTWHIDHIKPLVLFDLTDPMQFREAVHYTNLQPLRSIDNHRKGSTWKT